MCAPVSVEPREDHSVLEDCWPPPTAASPALLGLMIDYLIGTEQVDEK